MLTQSESEKKLAFYLNGDRLSFKHANDDGQSAVAIRFAQY